MSKLLHTIKEDEDEFVKAVMESYASELKKAKKELVRHEKHISELDKLFTRLYEDNVSDRVRMNALH